MARCNDPTCSCVIHSGDNTLVTGSGTPNDPYRISATRSGVVTVRNTDTINMSASGTGQVDDPFVIQSDLSAELEDLDNVSISSAPATGWVLGWDGSQWVPQTPATAAAGTILVQGCIGGDGSQGNPLYITVAPDGGLECNAQGLSLTVEASRRLNLVFATKADRDAALPNPAAGMSVYITDIKSFSRHNGTKWLYYSEWTDYVPTWGSLSSINPSIGNGSMVGLYKLDGDLCHVRVQILFGSTTSGGYGHWYLSLPFQAREVRDGIGLEQHLQTKMFAPHTGYNMIGWAYMNGNTTVIPFMPRNPNTTNMFAIRNCDDQGTPGSGIPYVATGFPFQEGSNMSMWGTYELEA